MKAIQVGIVGYGWAAGAHIGSFNDIENCQVTAVCSRRPLDAHELSRLYKSPIRVFNDYSEMLRVADLDIVSICTPHPLHPEQAIAAARAGKHLVIEKPVALSPEDLKRVEEAVKQNSVRAQVCFEVRAIGHMQTIRAVLDQDLLGKVHFAEVDYFHGVGPWYGQYTWNIRRDMGGSSLLTAGCHAMDVLLWFAGASPREVMSYATSSANPDFQPYEYPTTTCTLIRFDDGVVGKCSSVIDCIQPYQFKVHLVGAYGSVWNDKFYSSKLKGLDKTGWSAFHTRTADSGDVAHHPYRELFSDFVESVRSGKEPRFSFEQALLTHRVCYAADMSALEGRPVRLEEIV
jgi:predicted dehydrogenase